MGFTLLHTADFHLGKSFSELPPERAGQRRADVLATLDRVCRTARERRVDLLCIAGDLFDRAAPIPPLLATVRRVLGEANVPVLLIPGNHDALEAGSPYTLGRWPENVRVASAPGWQRVAIDGPELWAFGYTRGAARQSPWREFPGCAGDAVLVLHAACLAPGLAEDAGYFPFAPHDIPPCGYLALGHHHRAAQVTRQPQAWYPGTPEPLEPEVTPAAALLVTLEGSRVSTEALPVATRRHRLVTLEVSGLDSDDIWERALAETAREDLLTLELTGVLAAREPLDLAALHVELSARSFAAVVRADRLLLPGEPDEAEGVAGIVQQLAAERLRALPPGSAERVRMERAVRYAVLALEGRL